MPKISTVKDYDGFKAKIQRLDLSSIVSEVESALTSFPLHLEERKHANGTKGLRQAIDERFEAAGGWTKITVGGVDWTKSSPKGAKIGVEVQVSGRSDLLAVDVLHLKNDIALGDLDVGMIIVPDNGTSKFLTDRTPNLATAQRHVELHASDLPIRIMAFSHDGVGPALDKMRTNLGKI